mmetsp:Transcript_7118/g.9757  ORF Transcript_7118/g.9757 Transcript_7118/m.9757 type:complete len:249 (-) Transcript_7118:239-985(-)
MRLHHWWWLLLFSGSLYLTSLLQPGGRKISECYIPVSHLTGKGNSHRPTNVIQFHTKPRGWITKAQTGKRLIRMDSGISYIDTHIGNGRMAQKGDKVQVHYSLAGEDRRVVLDTRNFGFEPSIFYIGDGTVIPGLEQGVIGMAEGGNRTLRIPPELGYLEHELPDGLLDKMKPIFMAVTLKSIGNPYLRMQIKERKREVLQENKDFWMAYFKEHEYIEDDYRRHGFFQERRKKLPQEKRGSKMMNTTH